MSNEHLAAVEHISLCKQVSYETLEAVDIEMERLLNTAYTDVLALLQRNRAAYDALIEALTSGPDNTLSGEQVGLRASCPAMQPCSAMLPFLCCAFVLRA
jgi:ATP-dependent Zn protease